MTTNEFDLLVGVEAGWGVILLLAIAGNWPWLVGAAVLGLIVTPLILWRYLFGDKG